MSVPVGIYVAHYSELLLRCIEMAVEIRFRQRYCTNKKRGLPGRGIAMSIFRSLRSGCNNVGCPAAFWIWAAWWRARVSFVRLHNRAPSPKAGRGFCGCRRNHGGAGSRSKRSLTNIPVPPLRLDRLFREPSPSGLGYVWATLIRASGAGASPKSGTAPLLLLLLSCLLLRHRRPCRKADQGLLPVHPRQLAGLHAVVDRPADDFFR